jgi:Spy/CpxP family protein refolding chaperone
LGVTFSEWPHTYNGENERTYLKGEFMESKRMVLAAMAVIGLMAWGGCAWGQSDQAGDKPQAQAPATQTDQPDGPGFAPADNGQPGPGMQQPGGMPGMPGIPGNRPGLPGRQPMPGMMAPGMPGQMPGQMQPPRHGDGIDGIARMVLEQIKLSDEQRDKIDAILEDSRDKAEDAQYAVMKAHRALDQAVVKDGNEPAIRSAGAALGTAITNEALLKAKTLAQIKAVLTLQQQAELKRLMARQPFGGMAPGARRPAGKP